MFYKQSVSNVKVVVLSLDGGMLDLNRLRYNYFSRLCKQHNKTIDKEVFTAYLGNMNTMYEYSPISMHANTQELNNTLEKDLFSYAKLKPNIQKDGIEEVLHFFEQRDIKVAVVSTHKTKRAIQYLQLTKLYKYVDFVIGGDSECAPFPDSSLFKTICRQMHVKYEEVLVVANFPSMVVAANHVLMNVVYIPDLVPADNTIEASVYRIAKTPLEIINLFLFSKYDDVEIYSPIFGMSAKMDQKALEKTYARLLKEYADDAKIIDLVNQTYQYFLTRLHDKQIRSHEETVESIRNKVIGRQKQYHDQTITEVQFEELENSFKETVPVEDGEASTPDTKIQEIESVTIIDSLEEEEMIITIDDSDGELVTEESLDTDNIDSIVVEIEDTEEELLKNTYASSIEEEILSAGTTTFEAFKVETELDWDESDAFENATVQENLEELTDPPSPHQEEPSQLEQLVEAIKENEAEESEALAKEEPEEPISIKKRLLKYAIDFLYNAMVATILVLTGMIVYILLADYMETSGVIPSVLRTICGGYVGFINGIYGLLFNGLHSIFSFIPNYETFLTTSPFASKTGMETILYIIFHILLIYGFKAIIRIIYTREKEPEPEAELA